MKILKFIGLTFVQIGKQICGLPRMFVHFFQQRKLQADRAAREAERLDRIRNPAKYRGKEI